MLNFSISELCYSDTAKANKIDNIPKELYIYDNLLNLIFYVLQPIRNKFGIINITSGYRSGKLNNLVGGSSTSNHLLGCAVDLIPAHASFKQVYDYITKYLDFDECYIETNKFGVKWLHVAYRHKNNRKKCNPNFLA